MKENLLILFANNPLNKNSNTRLRKSIGFNNSKNLYTDLLINSISENIDANYDFKLYIDGEKDFFKKFIDLNLIYLQKGDHLGSRMYNAFKSEFKNYRNIILIGSDIPNITSSNIKEHFKLFNEKCNLIIGPAYDGGYYLIGLNRLYNVFNNIEWSTSEVFQQTLKQISHQNIDFRTLSYKMDIDNVDDLKTLIYKGILSESYKKYLDGKYN